MTYKEARYLIANTPYLGGSEQEKVEEAILMAIEALEKQIYVKCKDIITGDNVNIGEVCDKCGYFISIHRNYCLNCGQRIADWRDEG